MDGKAGCKLTAVPQNLYTDTKSLYWLIAVEAQAVGMN